MNHNWLNEIKYLFKIFIKVFHIHIRDNMQKNFRNLFSQTLEWENVIFDLFRNILSIDEKIKRS